MNKVNLLLGIYNSLPVSFDHNRREDLYNNTLRHIIPLFYNNKRCATTLYFSGTHLHWIKKKHPEFLAVVNDLVSRRQSSILGGAYYEPILPLVPLKDRIGQLELSNMQLREAFGKRFRGCWLPAGVWDPTLTMTLAGNGFNYTFVDEGYFWKNGYRDCYHIGVTEEQGKSLIIFPMHSSIGSSCFQVDPEQLLSTIKSIQKNNHDKLVVMFLNGNDINSVERHKWLESFILKVSQAGEWLNSVTPESFLKQNKKAPKPCYLSTSTYRDIKRYYSLHFHLKNQDFNNQTLLQKDNSLYKNFLLDWKEKKRLYSRMIFTNLLTNQLKGDKVRKKAAQDMLWKGESHFSMWRCEESYVEGQNAYKAMLEAEKIYRDKGVYQPTLSATDYNKASSREYLYRGNYYNAFFEPQNGSCFELDYLPVCWNYIASSTGSSLFLDHFFSSADGPSQSLSEERVSSVDYDTRKISKDGARLLSLENNLDVVTESGVNTPTYIQKRIIFKRNVLEVEYSIHNKSEKGTTYIFGPELNFAMPDMEHRGNYVALDKDAKELRAVTTEKSIKSCSGFIINDKANQANIQVDFSELMTLWRGNRPLHMDFTEWDTSKYELFFHPFIRFFLYPQEIKKFSFFLKMGKSK